MCTLRMFTGPLLKVRLGLIIEAVQGSWGSPPYKNDIANHVQKMAALRTACVSTLGKVISRKYGLHCGFTEASVAQRSVKSASRISAMRR